MVDSQPATWQRRPTERRQEILAAATTVFGEEGYARATLAGVARKAGVCAGTVSHYFGSKAALFEALVTDKALDFAADEPVMIAGPGGYRDLLHRVLADKWHRLNSPGMPELTLTVLRELDNFPAPAQQLFRQLSDRGRQRLEAVITAGREAGEFEVAHADRASHLIGALLLGAMLDRHFIAACTPVARCREGTLAALLDAADRLVGAVATSPSTPPDSPES